MAISPRILKVLYFTLFISFCSFPGYLLLYLTLPFPRGLGLTDSSISVIPSLVPFIFGPVWSTIIDYKRCHKLVLVGCPILSVVLVNLLWLCNGIAGNGPMTFPVIALIVALNSAVMSPVGSLLDTITLDSLPDSSLYGRQRLFGALSCGLSAFLTGYLTDKFSMLWMFHIYTISSLLFVVLVLASPIPWKWPVKSGPALLGNSNDEDVEILNQSGKFNRDSQSNFSSTESITDEPSGTLKSKFSNFLTPRTLIFFIVMFSMGTSYSMISNFLFLFLSHELHLPQSFLGLLSPFQIAMELPFFFYSNIVLSKLGTRKTILIAQLTLLCRVLLYNLLSPTSSTSSLAASTGTAISETIQPPYWLLPVELLHGLSFAFLNSASVQISLSIAPKGLTATTQSIVNAIFGSLGGLVGAGVGSWVFDNFGGIFLWRCTAGVILFGIGLVGVECLCEWRNGNGVHDNSVEGIGKSVDQWSEAGKEEMGQPKKMNQSTKQKSIQQQKSKAVKTVRFSDNEYFSSSKDSKFVRVDGNSNAGR
ncbi:major facilitator superfamily domain-containing protein [Paraphysoderma sedebokerense]|nr:major facilitator superfamily domain-containing protein [Paraphysoderma sedebokerense]